IDTWMAMSIDIPFVTATAEPKELLPPSEEPQHEDSQTEPPLSETPPVRAVLGELRVSSVTPSSVGLQWSVPEGSFDSFTLQYRDAQGQPQALPINGRSRSVTVPGLSPSRRYRFHLYGLQGGKRIERVSIDIVTATEEPEEPLLSSEEPQPDNHTTELPPTEAALTRAVLGELRVSSITPSSAGLQWSVPEGSFDSFMLQYRDAQGQPQALPIDGRGRCRCFPGFSGPDCSTPACAPGWGGTRCDIGGCPVPPQSSQCSPPLCLPITAKPEEPPSFQSVLGDFSVSSVTPSSVKLQWSVPEGPFDSFMLQYRDAQGQPQALPIDGRSRSVTVP
ncbi:TENX protein, partial [Furnarius figulus]|nr:TENX protein [Furnarius figulus]